MSDHRPQGSDFPVTGTDEQPTGDLNGQDPATPEASTPEEWARFVTEWMNLPIDVLHVDPGIFPENLDDIVDVYVRRTWP